MGTFTVGESRLRGGDRLRADATPTFPGHSAVGAVPGNLVSEALRFAGGRLMNALARAAEVPVPSPAADPMRPVGAMFDGRPGSPFRFSVLDDYPVIKTDLNMLRGSLGANQSDVPEWTREFGCIFAVGFFNIGGISTSAFQLESSPDFIQRSLGTSARQDVRCRPGETLRIVGEGLGAGSTAEAALITVQNLASGNWLKSDGTWQATPTACFTQSAATWGTLDRTFQVQSIEACRGYDEPVLRVRMARPQGAQDGLPCYFRKLALWPAVGFFGVWWPNVLGNFKIKLWGSESPRLPLGSVPIVELDPKRRVTFFDFMAQPQIYRYYRIDVDGDGYSTEEPVEFGEIVLTTLEELSSQRVVNPLIGFELDARFPQTRFSNAAGGQFVHLELDHSIRKSTSSFFLQSEAELFALRDRLHGIARGGATPTILVGPDALGTDLCLFGRFADTLPQRFPEAPNGTIFMRAQLEFQEEHGPLI